MTIECAHCNQSNEALPEAPYPGELGEKILKSICTNCWDKWIKQQTMIINENRLNLINPEARATLKQEMQAFLFEGHTDKPAGYQPPES